ncbi:MAG: hypothetical protein AAGD01_01250 [Acidobacteriota bacterium]
MNERQLDQALASLDPVQASETFTSSVLERLPEQDSATSQGPRPTLARGSLSRGSLSRGRGGFGSWPMALAASLCLMVASAFLLHQWFEQRHEERLAKIQQLRSEHQELTAALDELRELQQQGGAQPPDAVLLMDAQGDGLMVPFEPPVAGRGLRPAAHRAMPVEVRPASYRAY